MLAEPAWLEVALAEIPKALGTARSSSTSRTEGRKLDRRDLNMVPLLSEVGDGRMSRPMAGRQNQQILVRNSGDLEEWADIDGASGERPASGERHRRHASCTFRGIA